MCLQARLQLPPNLTQLVWIEGLPGTGKTFCIRTLTNINRQVHKTNSADLASAPTGCAASHIGGTTNHRAMLLPTKKADVNKPPSNPKNPNSDRMKEAHNRMSRVTAFFEDEHSMRSKEIFAWIEHRQRNLRTPTRQVFDQAMQPVPLPPIDGHSVPLHVAQRPHGGPDFYYSFGDVNQLPPVAQTPYYKPGVGKAGTSEQVGHVALSRFWNSNPEGGWESTVVMMENVVRQNGDEPYKEFLDHIRTGQLHVNDVHFMLDKCEDRMDPEKFAEFDDALNICSTWKEANSVSYKYLRDKLTHPVTIIRAEMGGDRTPNCCARGNVLPVMSAICVGCMVMLLVNKVVDEDLYNGSVGIVRDICYCPGEKVGSKGARMYVVVEFEKSKLSRPLVPGETNKKLVPIGLVRQKCKRGCCWINTVPLRVCYGLTGHKTQGMTTGQGEQFEKIKIHMPKGKMKNTPGWVLTAWTRSKARKDVALANKSRDLSKTELLRIGRTKAYTVRREFRKTLARKSETSMRRTITRITALHEVQQGQHKTFNGGCDYLNSWYRSTFPIEDTT